MPCRRLIPLTLAAGVAGCAQLPHNNVLLFGTDTKVALDVSSSATSGGAPQITLGYRRAEAVWMPLAVNDQDCPTTGEACRVKTATETRQTTTNETVTGPALYQGTTTTTTEKDGTEVTTVVHQDSYSVFASFGAKFTSSATGTQAEASGGLAQFFATGVAAQKIAENPNLDEALKLNSPGVAKGEADAKAAEAAAAAERTKQLEILEQPGTERTQSRFDKIIGCTNRSGSFSTAVRDKLFQAANATGQFSDKVSLIRGANSEQQLRLNLSTQNQLTAAMAMAADDTSNCI